MPFDYRLSGERPIAYIRGFGEVDYDSWLTTMHALRSDPGYAGDTPILLDVRDGENAPPPGTAPLVAHAWRSLAGGHAVAIVANPGSVAFGFARQVSGFTDGQVEVFTEKSAAVRWLESRRELSGGQP